MRAEKPDDKSVMTYVSQYFHRFASQSESETAGRRVANFVTFSQSKVCASLCVCVLAPMHEQQIRLCADSTSAYAWIVGRSQG
jgi:hypothetical protein